MCRIAMFRGVKDYSTLKNALDELEITNGGHGNGLYVSAWGDQWGQEAAIVKGVELDNDGVIQMLSYEPDSSFLYHTRWATSGAISGSEGDRLCHPFVAGDYVLAHNGVWSDWYDFKQELVVASSSGAPKSDTETAALLVERHGPGVLLTPTFARSGVWLLTRKEETLLIKRSGEFCFGFFGDGYFHASHIPTDLVMDKEIPALNDKVYRIDRETGVVEEVSLTATPESADPKLYEVRTSYDNMFREYEDYAQYWNQREEEEKKGAGNAQAFFAEGTEDPLGELRSKLAAGLTPEQSLVEDLVIGDPEAAATILELLFREYPETSVSLVRRVDNFLYSGRVGDQEQAQSQ